MCADVFGGEIFAHAFDEGGGRVGDGRGISSCKGSVGGMEGGDVGLDIVVVSKLGGAVRETDEFREDVEDARPVGPKVVESRIGEEVGEAIDCVVDLDGSEEVGMLLVGARSVAGAEPHGADRPWVGCDMPLPESAKGS